MLKLKSNKALLDEFSALMRDSLAQILSRLGENIQPSHEYLKIDTWLTCLIFISSSIWNGSYS